VPDRINEIREAIVKFARRKCDRVVRERMVSNPPPGVALPLTSSSLKGDSFREEKTTRENYNKKKDARKAKSGDYDWWKDMKTAVFLKGEDRPRIEAPPDGTEAYASHAFLKEGLAKATAMYPIHEVFTSEETAWKDLKNDKHAMAAFVQQPDKNFACKMVPTVGGRWEMKPLLLMILYRLYTSFIYNQESLMAVHPFVKNDARGRPIHEGYRLMYDFPDKEEPFPVRYYLLSGAVSPRFWLFVDFHSLKQ
jgi:hypothetical protein